MHPHHSHAICSPGAMTVHFIICPDGSTVRSHHAMAAPARRMCGSASIDSVASCCIPICSLRTAAQTSRSQKKPFHAARGMLELRECREQRTNQHAKWGEMGRLKNNATMQRTHMHQKHMSTNSARVALVGCPVHQHSRGAAHSGRRNRGAARADEQSVPLRCKPLCSCYSPPNAFCSPACCQFVGGCSIASAASMA